MIRRTTHNRGWSRRPLIAGVLAASLCAAAFAAPVFAPVPLAHADTYTDLINAQNSHQESVQREAELREQLAGVKSDLADKIVELDDLTNNQIPAAAKEVETANAAAAAAKSEADSAAQRLAAAQKDKENLEAEIKKTGEDYDDAHAAVAQVARESMHGSDTSDVMSVMTGSTDTKEFIQQMQSRDALSRNEANAASEAADGLSISMNRGERLKAIEARITTYKSDADEKSAAAQSAAADAQAKSDALDAQRIKGEQMRSDLEGRKDELSTAAAQQAAETVMLQSQIDANNRKYRQEQAAEAARVQQMQAQGTTRPPQGTNTGTAVQPSRPSQPAQPSQPSTPAQPSQPSQPSRPSGGSSGGQGTSNGDYGNAYAAGQCTWWAYERRKQMGIGTPSYLGNGGDWASTAPSYGLRVDNVPQVGAALSFPPGQEGASIPWGHVAVVESVGANSVTISESNVAGLYTITYRTLYNPGRFLYVH
ncbi:CHAP domain-containing protein [uncultured Bifidobacterium sp.]|uniref:CHAP domain-containing protein n=1 Tax=uncultured Bifidobacterium sp. TaxID=165187 RepID=UPI00259115BC|nr:CHAP domain-containing protein [uncultured Bifidobacterium sp.]